MWEGYQEEAEGEQNGEEEAEKDEDVPAATEEEESERITSYQKVCTSGRILLVSCTTAPPPQVLVVGVIDPVTFWGQLEDQGLEGITQGLPNLLTSDLCPLTSDLCRSEASAVDE